MHDPYLYEGTSVLINKLGIKDQDTLDEAEADYVVLRLKELAQNTLPGDYHTPHFFQMHNYIFQDIYDWAGQPRKIGIYKEEAILGGQSIEYSDPFDIVNDTRHILAKMREKPWHDMDIRKVAIEFCASLAELWKVHPFREGNTRTTVTFCCQFIDAKYHGYVPFVHNDVPILLDFQGLSSYPIVRLQRFCSRDGTL